MIKPNKHLRIVVLVGFAVVTVVGLAGAMYYDLHKPSAKEKAEKVEMVMLQNSLKEADQRIKPPGFIENHTVNSQSHSDGYGGKAYLYPAASNYYDSKFTIQDFDNAKLAILALGYGQSGKDYATEARDLETGTLEKCYIKRSAENPAYLLCVHLFKDAQTTDFIGGGNNLAWFFHNSVKTSRPFDLIITYKRNHPLE